ncbi:hypothetical protein [Undibacterium terreum]|uniref:Uncharacterized protein n=1 Tax=Undibacterium terreum TaxID=1224302 RepID=A0A916UBQ0_9BURK|nr:hypothetical protein [Undibacterium terreum]GGC66474.1 hypothetical protein GCM10011396_11940 [Undibacterium terreum]
MKQIVGVLIFTGLAWMAALLLGGILWLLKFRKTARWTAGILFFAPFVLSIVLYVQNKAEDRKFTEDVAYVKELCAKNGGDHIYKTVDNVEGIFRMKERHPDYDDQLHDQFGMIDPYGAAQEDPNNAGEFLSEQQISSTAGYVYIEAPLSYKVNGPPYKRFYLKPTGQKIGEKHAYAPNAANPELEIVTEEVSKRASRYGYLIEDISTREMRERWIGGGRIKVIDLQTNELLAERVGYFRAIGPAALLHWSGGICVSKSKNLSIQQQD